MSAWWPMEAPPLPGPDPIRNTCQHGYPDEECVRTQGAHGPEVYRFVVGGKTYLGLDFGLLPVDGVVHLLGSYNGTADTEEPMRESQPWIYRGTVA